MQASAMNWPVLAAVAVAVLLVAWWLLSRARKPARRRSHAPDVLDEGAAPAQRNQALIDSSPAASAAFAVPPAADAMGGVAEVIAAAVQEEAAEAGAAEVPSGVPDQPDPAPAPAAASAADDLTRIKGLGPKLAALLGSLGVTSFAQIADWTEADLVRIDPQLGAFAGRPARDKWIEQARLLASGDIAGYEDRFGKL
jgi:predicted flap endonuclease-1-like 5' DNA nuclease